MWKIGGAINTVEKLDYEVDFKKVNELLTCRNVWFAHNSLRTIRENVNRITESAQLGFV